jgi:hypothetical protein
MLVAVNSSVIMSLILCTEGPSGNSLNASLRIIRLLTCLLTWELQIRSFNCSHWGEALCNSVCWYVLYCNVRTHLIVNFVSQNIYSFVSHRVISTLHWCYQLCKCTLYVLRRYTVRPIRDTIAADTYNEVYNMCAINGAPNGVAFRR